MSSRTGKNRPRRSSLKAKLARFNLIQEEVVAGQEETAQLVAKKLKKTLEYQFCRKGNKEQFKFNGTVSDSIQSMSELLEKNISTLS